MNHKTLIFTLAVSWNTMSEAHDWLYSMCGVVENEFAAKVIMSSQYQWKEEREVLEVMVAQHHHVCLGLYEGTQGFEEAHIHRKSVVITPSKPCVQVYFIRIYLWE